MAQAARGAAQRGVHSSKVSSSSSSVGGGPPSHLLLMELKHRMLAALAKLSDRDTQQLAVDDLQKLVEVLSPEGLSMCLSCLYDTDTQQKSIVKKECVRMFATLAALHGPSLVPHLNKIVASIVRRLKDPDTGVRDACVDAMGSLASHIVYLLPPPASKPHLGVASLSLGTRNSNAQEPNVANAPTRLNTSAHMANVPSTQELSVAHALTRENSSAYMSTNMQDPALNPPLPRAGLGGTHSSNLQELNAFVKPLFDALSEQNRSVQSGAAMCLARVITSARGNPQSPSMCRFCQRICKLLTNPNFLAKAALLPVIASLSQVGAVNSQNIISTMVPCVHDALECHEWATRKAAAETLSTMGSSLGMQLTTFKSGTLLLLESCRFDKVKPVRDSVQDAIQTWKSLPGLERDIPASACSTPPANGSTGSCPNTSEKLPGILKKKGAALTDKKPNADFFNKLETQSTNEWHIEVAVPRSCPPPSMVACKESDHDVLSKTKSNDYSNLIPNEYISGNDSPMHDHGKENIGMSNDVEDEEIFRHGSSYREDDLHSSKRQIKAPDHNVLKSWDDVDSNHNLQRVNHVSGGERCLALRRSSDSHPCPWDITSPPSLKSTSDKITSNGNSHVGNHGGEAANWLLIQRQLSQLEFQQANIMDLFQEFMGMSRNSMFALEARIKVLERVVEDIAQDLEVPASDCLDKYNGEMSENVYADSSEYLSPQREDYYNMQSSMTRNGRLSLSGHSSFTASASKEGADLMIREPAYNTSTSAWRSNPDMHLGEEQWTESPSRSHLQSIEEDDCRLETHPSIDQCFKDLSSRANRINAGDDDSFGMNNNVRNVDAPTKKNGDVLRASNARENDVFRDQEQMAARRVWDTEPINSSARSGNHVWPGEGPSARSVWQASKDEATLAAIRGTGEEEGESNSSTGISSKQIVTEMEASQAVDNVKKKGERVQNLSSSASSCSSSNAQIGNGKGKFEQEGKRAYWRLWSRAMELVQVGNMDCAYTEVLGSGDELMLVRLMNKTGPVLEKLSSNTANEMLHNVAQLLRQHSFFDFSLPWVQQLADLMMDMGANSLDILSDVKRDLIHSVQEASHMEIPNDWLGNSINELCSILMDAWGAEQVIH